MMLARSLGAGRIVATDISQYRLEAAQRFGADVTIHAGEDVPARLRETNSGRLADTVIVCTGAVSAIEQAFESVDRGGTVLLFAPTDPGVTIPISINDLLFRNDITVTTSYAGSPADYQTALDLIAAGTVSVHQMITHRLELAETGEGFRLVAEADESIKVIIEPQR